jgi:hypothetical protein
MVENMNGLVELLCRRDNISKNEAWSIVEETQADIMEAIYNGEDYEEVVSILEYDLGLEPDYLTLFLE